MKIQTILLIAISFLFFSCGTPKVVENVANGPLIQTKFLGLEFGDSPTRVYRRLSRYRPIRSNDGSITITDQEFGGLYWHFVQTAFIDKMLYVVNFQQEYSNESTANDRFASVYQMLRTKYGEMKVIKEGKGFSFTDENKNMVVINVESGTSKSGEEFWYCNLTYYWGAGALLTYMKSFSEI